MDYDPDYVVLGLHNYRPIQSEAVSEVADGGFG